MKIKEFTETPRSGDDGGNFASILDSLLDHKKMIAAATVLIFLIGCGYAFLSPPVYEANALIKLGDSDELSRPMAPDTLSYYVSPSFHEKSSAESEIQVIGSRYVVSRAVAEKKLYIEARPRRFPLIGQFIARHSKGLSSPGIGGLGGFLWGEEKILMDNFDVPERLEEKKFVIRLTGNERYELSGDGLPSPVVGRIGAQEKFETTEGPLSIRVAAINAQTGGEFIVRRESQQLFVEELQKKLMIWEVGNKSNVVKIALQGTQAGELADTVREIANAYVTWNRDRKSRMAEEALSYLKKVTPEIEQQVKDSETAYNSYRDTNGLLNIDEEQRLLLKQVADNNDILLGFQLKRQEMLARMSPSNPDVVALDDQIQTTQRAIARLGSRIQAMPQAEQGAFQLMRNVRVNTDLYLAMRKYAEEMQVLSAGKVGTAEIIDTVEIPKKPVKPVKALVLLVSLLVGALVSGSCAVLWDRLHRGVTDSEDIEAATGSSVYATIPFSSKQAVIMRRVDEGFSQQLPLAHCYPRDLAIESLRTLRSALQLILVAAPNNVVMMAGPLPGIGKSFLAANLATVLGAGGKRVLLIDGDLRKGQLNRYLGVKPAAGLSDVLSNGMSVGEAITRGVARNLDLLQTGVYPPSASDLLVSDRFKEVVREVSRQYDIVLIDAPAVLAVSDASVMAPVAGSIFLVAQYAETHIGEIDESIKRLGQAGGRISGILLNRVKVRNSNYLLARRYGTHAYVARYYDSETT